MGNERVHPRRLVEDDVAVLPHLFRRAGHPGGQPLGVARHEAHRGLQVVGEVGNQLLAGGGLANLLVNIRL